MAEALLCMLSVAALAFDVVCTCGAFEKGPLRRMKTASELEGFRFLCRHMSCIFGAGSCCTLC